MKKTKNGSKILLFLLLVVLVFALTAFITAKMTAKSKTEDAGNTQNEQSADTQAGQDAESGDAADTIIDKYSMQEYCAENAQAVFAALKSEDTEKLEELLIQPEGADSVMSFAEWKDADFDNAISMGSGSLTAEPDAEGRMDESERFFVDIGDTRYVLFIETLTSDRGRTNDGVSAVGVTTFSYFDADDYQWNGEKVERSVLCGELFWNR